MAIDSRNKRASVVGFALAFKLIAPNPDGAIAVVADRAQIAGFYAGITPTPPVVGVEAWEASPTVRPYYAGTVGVGAYHTADATARPYYTATVRIAAVNP